MSLANELMTRRKRLFTAMNQQGVDLLLVFHPASIFWLTGVSAKSYQSFQCVLANSRNGTIEVLTRRAEEEEFRTDGQFDAIRIWSSLAGDDPLKSLGSMIGEVRQGNEKIGVECVSYYIHPAHYAVIKDEICGGEVKNLTTIVHDLRLIKSDHELGFIKEAARIADLAMARVGAGLKAGATELDVAAGLYHEIMSNGGDAPVVPINFVSGERNLQSHGAPTSRVMKTGDTGNAEFCVSYRSYLSSLGRQFSVGRPSARMTEIHSVVSQAQDDIIAFLKPGTATVDAYATGVKALAKAGGDFAPVHTLGYSLATGFAPATGDLLQFVPGNKYRLEPGMVLSICPNVYSQAEGFGIRIVDNVLITEDGALRLSMSPREILVGA